MNIIQQVKLLSIIIPVYNMEKYLKECLDSCVKKKYQDKIEIIIVDDGSTDNSVAISEGYKQRFKNVALILQSNKGLSAARNTGIRRASGKYLLFLDSDDFLKPSAIDSFFEILLNNIDIDIVHFNLEQFTDSEKLGNSDLDKGQFDKGRLVDGRFALIELLKRKLENFSCAMIIKKSIFTSSEIWFPEGRKFEDISTTYKLFGVSHKTLLLNFAPYMYRIRPGSITNTPNKSSLTDITSALDEMRRYLKDNHWQVYENFFGNYEIAYLLVVYFDEYRITGSSRNSTEVALREHILSVFDENKDKYISLKYRISCLLLKINCYIMVQNIRTSFKK